MKHIEAGVLDVAYRETGPADGPAVILIHGFPYDIHSYAEVAPILAEAGMRVVMPFMRGYGPTRFLDEGTMRSGQQGAFAADLLALMDALGIEKAYLGGYDWGGRAACVVAALWPERCLGLVSAGNAYNIHDVPGAAAPTDPESERRNWYQYYFNTQRGRDGLTQNRRAFCRLLWTLWSPDWRFSEAEFERSAASFDNEDFVDVVIHSYRTRYGYAPGDPAYEAIEEKLAAQPSIGVPTITLSGASDGVQPPPLIDGDSARFTGPYRRDILPGIGHNLPQEAPHHFAAAMLELAGREG